MSETTTATRIHAILVEHLGVSPEDVKPETLLVPHHDDMGRQLDSHHPHLSADSLDIVELVMAFEEEFGIEISDDEGETLNRGTVKDCCDLVDSKRLPAAA